MAEGIDWVEIIEPTRRDHMFANLKTGQCLWEPPDGAKFKPTHENQWWELFDSNTKCYYYYNATSQKTVWHKPKDGDIIPLSKLQMLKAKEEARQSQEEQSNNNTTILTESVRLSKKNSLSRSSSSFSSIKRGNSDLKEHSVSTPSLEKRHSSDMMYGRQDSNEEGHYQNFSVITSQNSKNQTGGSNLELSTFTNNNNTFSVPSPIKKSATLPIRKTDTNQHVIETQVKSTSVKHPPPKKPPRTHVAVDVSVVESKELDKNKENIIPDSYESIGKKSPDMKRKSLLGSSISNIEDQEITPVSSVPPAPPPPPPPPLPPSATQRYPRGRDSLQDSHLSMYDNVTRSIYDNLSDSGSFDEATSPCVDSSISSMNDTFASADDSYTPSGTLLRNDETNNSRSSYYERLNDTEDEIHTISHPITDHELDKPPAAKRSPLTRMKSDTLDVQKRAKFAKNAEIASTNFRPISMMNLAGSSTGTNKGLKKVTTESSELPKELKTSLNTHRKGVFRRRVSIHSMLSWSKTPIKKPMVMTRDKQQRKDAVEVFKLILQCMGDKSSRKSFDALAVEITTKGWQTTTLRDEIYVQLCKQTTCNEKMKSLKLGWELLTACLSMFPPSSKFHSYLEGYIYKYLEVEDLSPIAKEAQIDKYAKHCYKQLERICDMGAKRGLKGPTSEEIQSAIKRVFNPSMFGNTLEDIMDMQAQRFPDNRLPWILTTLTEAILLLNGLQTEGIFRVPGDIDCVNSLKLQIDRWESAQGLHDPHTPGSLLKLWFRDLYEPLIPQRFYDQCIHNCDNPDVCLNIVNSLPPINNLVFSYLIRLLQAFMIPANVQHSKMGEDNLAMVWAPNCLRCPSDDPREIFENTRKEMTFLRTVIKCLDTSFLEGVV